MGQLTVLSLAQQRQRMQLTSSSFITIKLRTDSDRQLMPINPRTTLATRMAAEEPSAKSGRQGSAGLSAICHTRKPTVGGNDQSERSLQPSATTRQPTARRPQIDATPAHRCALDSQAERMSCDRRCQT